MTREEAILAARSVSDHMDWMWLQPVKAWKHRDGLFGPIVWSVVSGADGIGLNVFVTIDDKTGEILRKGFSPR